MRTKQSYYIFLPSAIKEMIDQHVKRNRLNHYYLVHYILYRSARRKKKYNGFICVGTKKFKEITGKSPETYLITLRDLGIIIHDGVCIKDKKRYYYKINPSLKLDYSSYEITPSNRLYAKMKKEFANKRAHINRYTKHEYDMCKYFMSLDFDKHAAIADIKRRRIRNSNRLINNFLAIEMFTNRDYLYFKRNKTNYRIDSNLTNMPKKFRKFLLGEKLFSIDIINSQPFFLIILLQYQLNKTNSTIPLLSTEIKSNKRLKGIASQAFDDYLFSHQYSQTNKLEWLDQLTETTCAGLFYDDLATRCGDGMTRKKVKPITFNVLFSENEKVKDDKITIPFLKEKQRFASAYPELYEAIYALKSSNNKDLANQLSAMESFMIIDVICKRLHDAGIVPLTIHDSVIVKEGEIDLTMEIIQNSFLEYASFVPALKLEAFNFTPAIDITQKYVYHKKKEVA